MKKYSYWIEVPLHGDPRHEGQLSDEELLFGIFHMLACQDGIVICNGMYDPFSDNIYVITGKGAAKDILELEQRLRLSGLHVRISYTVEQKVSVSNWTDEITVYANGTEET